jgi:hypothetical protein
MSYKSLRFLDMFVPEQELSVEIAQINSVEINDVDFPETCKDKVLQKLASDSTSSYH